MDDIAPESSDQAEATATPAEIPAPTAPPSAAGASAPGGDGSHVT
jgi:hypothetical protein